MKRLFVSLLALGVLIAVNPSAFGSAITNGTPTATLMIDDEAFEIPIVQDGKVYRIGSEENPVTGEGQGGAFSLSAILNPDPFIVYAVGLVDFGAPSTFTFFFSTPIVFPAAPSIVTGSIVGGLTDATGDGVSATPALLGDPDGDLVTEMQEAYVDVIAFPTVNMGVDVGPAAAFPGPNAPGAFFPYGPFGAGPMPGPAGPWSFLGVVLSVTLSGGSDAFGATGFASIVPVPEPSTMILCCVGLLGLGLATWRRRR